MDKELDAMVSKMTKKSKKENSKVSKSEEPKDAMGWLRKAYIDSDPKDGAPKVGDIGYV
jgi:hypothetical protein